MSSVYTQMNVSDAFAQLAIEPRGLRARIEVHALHLASGADLWYLGSGATSSKGRYFGYSGRGAGGDTALGTVLEGAVDLPIRKHWSINGYAGVVSGGLRRRELVHQQTPYVLVRRERRQILTGSRCLSGSDACREVIGVGSHND